MLGTTLADRYKITKALGSGGFSKTFIATDTQHPGKRRCIVKKLQPESDDLFTVKTSRRLFATEVKVLRRLGSYDQIPQLFDDFEEDQDFFLVEQYIEGTNLKREFGWRRWSEAKLIAFLQDVLTTLAYVHQRRVIHRDIKPANLIRRKKDKKVVLIDFGSVKNKRRIAQTVVIGTDGYMPSEQSIGRPNFSSDVYAVGIIAIQALTGMDPTKGKLSFDPKTGEIAWRRYISINPLLGEIIDKMVRYDFRQRYPSAVEALADVNELVAEVPSIERRQMLQTAASWGVGMLGVGLAYGAFTQKWLFPSANTFIKQLFGQADLDSEEKS
ncbi:serine/threonine-protein kinase [Acaryochloris sp. IP29b_bin.148]|uniref:serine/threonine-protein kinase n=1 Tax=Acaryochloris sp. IP29b_bin.148 TaxID=2969218 RepID=UPI00262C3A73|nr:serine/threonine-protein kinase [Acaryochloris sp. IP29b_bin.148]